MSAPSLNAIAVALPCAAGPASAKPQAAGQGGLAGFEALLAGLFGEPQAQAQSQAQTQPQAQVQAQTPNVPVGQAVTELLAAGEPGEGEPAAADADATGTEVVADPTAVDPSLALLAGVGQPVDATAQSVANSDKEPPAWGRDKAKGTPAAPALLHANANARLADKGDLAPESEEAPAPPQEPQTQAKFAKLDTPPPAAPRAPPQAPAVPEPAAPAAALAADAAAPDAPTAPQTTPELATAALRTAAPVTAKPATPRAAKPEQDAEAPAPIGAPKATPGAPKIAAAFAAQAAAAGAATDRQGQEASAKADNPDGQPLAPDAPAPSQSAQAAPLGHTPVRGAPETVAHLAAQIVKKLEGRSTQFDLELHPADLGKVGVRIEIGASGQMSAAMTFDTPQAAAELRARAHELQRQLEQAGFNLTGGLSFDVAGDRSHARQGWDGQGEQSGGAFRGDAFRAALETAGEALDTALSGGVRLRRGIASGVDVRI